MVFDANIDATGDCTDHSNHHTEVSLISILKSILGFLAIVAVKYKTLKKLKLQVLCGNLLDHIEDLEEELKEAKVEKAKVESRLVEELELKEAVFFVGNGTGPPGGGELELKEALPTSDDDNGTGTGTTTSNGEEGEDDVRGVEEGDINVKVNATSSEAKSAKLAKLVKLAKSTNLWCLSPYVPLSQEARDKDKQKQRKVCPVNLRGRSAPPTTAGASIPRSASWPTTARGRSSPRPRAHFGTCGSQGETPLGTATAATTTTRTIPCQARGGVPGRGAQGEDQGN
jgi:hypothetical protein